jgi:hypothetical protein
MVRKRVAPQVGGKLPRDFKRPKPKKRKPRNVKGAKRSRSRSQIPKTHTKTHAPGGPPAAKELQIDAARTVRRHQALELKIAGATYAQIAAKLKVAPSTVYFDVHEALAEHDEDMRRLAPRYRELALAEIEAVKLNNWTAMQRGDTKAAQVVLRCVDAKARITGVYAPLKVAQTDGQGRPFKQMSTADILRRLAEFAEQDSAATSEETPAEAEQP